jgi:dTDP-4-dehydrorhamnose 3,5-epimerase
VLFTETELDGAYIVDLEPREDDRGFFARAWCANEFAEHGLSTELVQSNLAFNRRQGTLRGMHFQREPHAEVKLVRCTRGAVYDAIIDLRSGSQTYMRWIGIELTDENRRALYVPKGFAHGYQTLVDDTEIFYQVSEFYSPEFEDGVRWNDPAFGIRWPDPATPLLSSKDAAWPDYRP